MVLVSHILPESRHFFPSFILHLLLQSDTQPVEFQRLTSLITFAQTISTSHLYFKCARHFGFATLSAGVRRRFSHRT